MHYQMFMRWARVSIDCFAGFLPKHWLLPRKQTQNIRHNAQSHPQGPTFATSSICSTGECPLLCSTIAGLLAHCSSIMTSPSSPLLGPINSLSLAFSLACTSPPISHPNLSSPSTAPWTSSLYPSLLLIERPTKLLISRIPHPISSPATIPIPPHISSSSNLNATSLERCGFCMSSSTVINVDADVAGFLAIELPGLYSTPLLVDRIWALSDILSSHSLPFPLSIGLFTPLIDTAIKPL